MKLTKRNILLGVFAVFSIWVLSAVGINFFFDSSERGTFGDMFGAVNALFSGLALFGIIVSILIQQNELNLQRLELKDTRKEFKINRITTILFKQVEYLNSLIEKILFKYPGFEGSHTEVNFDTFLKEIQNGILVNKNLIDNNSEIISSLINKLISIIDDFEYLLEFNNLSDDEKYQMSFLFRSNIKPDLYEFLHFQIEFLKESLETDIEKNENAKLLNKLIKLQLSNIYRIFKFGKR